MTTDFAPLATTSEMVEELRAGRMIVLVDDEDRENEGDFVVAGQCITAEHVVQMNRLASGIITVPMPAPWLSRLHLESMVPDNAESMAASVNKITASERAVRHGLPSLTNQSQAVI